MTKENIILLADAYKYSHHKLYYPGTNYVFSYMESRGGWFNEVVMYGLQYFLKEYLQGPVITADKIKEAEELLPRVFGRHDVFGAENFRYILEKHGGYLPIRIKSVPEGMPVPVSNVMMSMENTDPKCFWLTNFLETLLLQVWYPCTVATLSREIKKIVKKYYAETATPGSEAGIDFVLNDFGFRGVSSVESAGLGGSAHLINFMGSDTLQASVFARRYYNTNEVYGLSIPATEHSICTLLGPEGEKEIFRHVLDTFPGGLVACVSDSYDIFNACSEYWGGAFKDKILSREGRLVVRPDSGDPVMTLLKVYEILFEKFGFTTNAKGYKVLPDTIRVIQGDGINHESIASIYEALKKAGISAENLVLGMGGALLQKVDRDTQKFAFKCSYAELNGKGTEVKKAPREMGADGVIRPSFKASKGGKLKLVHDATGYRTLKYEEEPGKENLLQTVFENGKIIKEYTFEEVRQQAALRD